MVLQKVSAGKGKEEEFDNIIPASGERRAIMRQGPGEGLPVRRDKERVDIMSLPKAYISPSQLNMYLRCPAQYKFRYVDQIILPPRSALTKGKAVHKGQEHNYRQKIDTFRDLKLSEVQEATAAEFEAGAQETEWESGEDVGKIKDDTISLASLYHTEVAPQVQPVLVEEKVTVEFEDADYSLLGFIDVLDNKGFIRDTKTTARTPSEDEITKNLQLTAYSLAHRHIMGTEETGVKLDYLVQTKTPKVVSLEAKRTEQDIKRFLSIVGRVTDAIRAGSYYPNPGNFMCSEKNCGYWKLCHQEF